MMSKEGFIYHDEYYELMSELTPSEQSTMLYAMVNFNRTGEEPDFDDRLLRIVWAAISTRMKADAEAYRERCEKNRENAKKRTLAIATDRKRSQAIAADIDIDTDIDTDIDNNNTITDFDRFWSEYPKKVGKKAAQRAFQVAKRTTTIDVMIAAIQKQKRGEQWTKNGGQFVPNPATWLNQGRWDDEIRPPVRAGTLSASMTHDYDMEELKRRAKE